MTLLFPFEKKFSEHDWFSTLEACVKSEKVKHLKHSYIQKYLSDKFLTSKYNKPYYIERCRSYRSYKYIPFMYYQPLCNSYNVYTFMIRIPRTEIENISTSNQIEWLSHRAFMASKTISGLEDVLLMPLDETIKELVSFILKGVDLIDYTSIFL